MISMLKMQLTMAAKASTIIESGGARRQLDVSKVVAQFIDLRHRLSQRAKTP